MSYTAFGAETATTTRIPTTMQAAPRMTLLPGPAALTPEPATGRWVVYGLIAAVIVGGVVMWRVTKR